MNRVSESQLREYNQAKAITAARIQRHRGGYILVIQVNWKEEHQILFSQRNHPRVWMSLDRMISHLVEVAPSIVRLELVLEDDLIAVESRVTPFP
jgi:hypothetical protein